MKQLYIIQLATAVLLSMASSTAQAQSQQKSATVQDAIEGIAHSSADSLLAAGPLSLEACIKYAIDHNITVRQSAITVETRDIELNTAKNRRLPGFSASVGENISFGRGLTADNTYSNSNTTSTSFSLGGDIPIFQGFDISNSIKASSLNLDAAMADLEKAKDDIRVAITKAYVQILYNEEILRMATHQVAHDTELLAQIQAKLEVGTASEAQLAAQKATLAQAKFSEVQAENTLKLSLLDISQLLELPSPDGIEIVVPDVALFEPKMLMKPEIIYAEAVNIRPAVQSAQLKLQSADVAIARAKGAYLPTLSLSGGIGTNFYTSSKVPSKSFGNQLKDNFNQYVSLSLRIPIFQRYATRNSVRTAQLNYQSASLQLENTHKSLYKEIQQAYYSALAAQHKFSSSRESSVSAELHYQLTEEKYAQGKANISEYNDATKNYLTAKSEHLKAKYESLFQTKLLDFYRGAPLEL